MYHHGLSEADWERADYYHSGKADRLAEREREQTMNAREALEYLQNYLLHRRKGDLAPAPDALAVLGACVDERDALRGAYEAAMEWAASFPLGIASTQPDIEAAADIYERCDVALRGEK